MAGIHVELIVSTARESRVRVTGAIGEHDLWITTDGRLAQDDLTPWLSLLIPIAMVAHEPLLFHGPVDLRALANATLAQNLLHSWYPGRMRIVDVTADGETADESVAQGTVALFSGGVDSFHTAMRHQTSHLLFIHGLDIPLDAPERLAEASQQLSVAAEQMGRTLVQARTNIRNLSDRWSRWDYEYHGAAIAGITLAHASLWGRGLIASTYPPAQLHPWGSHPDLDPLWASSRVSVLHDALEWNRFQKVAEIVAWPVAMEHLRVCWKNADEAYNCGRCEKCLRTTVEVRLADGHCATLPDHRHLALRVARVPIRSASGRAFARVNMAEARRMGEPMMAAALGLSMATGKVAGSRPYRVARGYLREAWRRASVRARR